MTMMPSGPLSGPRASSNENDIYTLLCVIAFLFALVATAYVGYRTVVLFDSLIPPGGS